MLLLGIRFCVVASIQLSIFISHVHRHSGKSRRTERVYVCNCRLDHKICGKTLKSEIAKHFFRNLVKMS